MTGANDKAEDVARTIVGTHLSCPTDLDPKPHLITLLL
jgi:hypothetical protein